MLVSICINSFYAFYCRKINVEWGLYWNFGLICARMRCPSFFNCENMAGVPRTILIYRFKRSLLGFFFCVTQACDTSPVSVLQIREVCLCQNQIDSVVMGGRLWTSTLLMADVAIQEAFSSSWPKIPRVLACSRSPLDQWSSNLLPRDSLQ